MPPRVPSFTGCRLPRLLAVLAALVCPGVLAAWPAAAAVVPEMRPVSVPGSQGQTPQLSPLRGLPGETALGLEGGSSYRVDTASTPLGLTAFNTTSACPVRLPRWVAHLGLEQPLYTVTLLHLLHCCWRN